MKIYETVSLMSVYSLSSLCDTMCNHLCLVLILNDSFQAYICETFYHYLSLNTVFIMDLTETIFNFPIFYCNLLMYRRWCKILYFYDIQLKLLSIMEIFMFLYELYIYNIFTSAHLSWGIPIYCAYIH